MAVGYDQAIARVNELRQVTGGAPLPAVDAPGTTAGAAFQQQLLGAATQDPALAALVGSDGLPEDRTGGLPLISAEQLYGALQAGGLGAQAGMVAPAAPAPTSVTGKTDGLDPALLQRLDAVGRELGVKVDVVSGRRSREEQARLYQAYLNGTGNLAAPPGQSNHEQGVAADVYVDGVPLASVPGGREAAQRNGLHFPVGGEAWHVERSDRG